MKHATLVFPLQEQRVLLGMKKRGFGTGKWNGFGGKLKDGETPAQAASRELEEETGIHTSPEELRKVAELSFSFPSFQEWNFFVHAFVVKEYTGTPSETEEMKPEWFAHDTLPFDSMWADDRYWLPLVLKGETLKGAFVFNDDRTTIKSHSIEKAEF